MSAGDAETLAAAHACFEGNVMVEGYYLVTAAVNEDGERVWALRSDPNASVFTEMGLARLTHAFIEEGISGLLGWDQREDD